MNRISCAIVVIGALIEAACGSNPLTGASAVTGGAWKLRNLQLPNFSIVEISEPDKYTVEFKDGGALAVKADCNVCGGSYSMAGGDALQIKSLACTLAYCGDASHDAAFLALLTATRTHGVEHATLSLYSDGVLRLTH